MTDEQEVSSQPIVFVVDKDADERETIRAAIEGLGCLAIPFASLEQASALLKSDAACSLVVVSTDALDDSRECFDKLLEAKNPPPEIIVTGVDPKAKVVLHCLNRGAVDFLPKPVDPAELANAVENVVYRDADSTMTRFFPDAIVASSHVTGWIEITAASKLEMFRRLQRFSDALFASRLSQEVCEDLKMAVEEVGRNAVEWGNKFNPDKQVHVSYCLFKDRVVIKVEDEGEGFAPQNVPDPTADPIKTMRERSEAGKRPGGYGVYMLQKLVDEVVYNEKGNTVLLIKYLPEE